MLKDRDDLIPTPRLVDIFRIHQTADWRTEHHIGEIQHNQRQQEVRRRQAQEADKRQPVVAPTVLVRRGIKADRKGDDPRKDDRHHGN